MIAFVEVAPEDGGWKVSVIVPSRTRVLSHRRRKRSAMLVGTGAAMVLQTELRVKDRLGRYTKAAASFGGDSPRRRG